MTPRSNAKDRLSDWFRQWRVPLRKFLLARTGVPAADINDVAQEVFLRLLRYDKAELIEHLLVPFIGKHAISRRALQYL